MLGAVDELAKFLGESLVTLTGLVCGDLERDGPEEVVIPGGITPQQSF
jgi:hypothetical protein